MPLDETSTALLTQWFDAGQASGKTKCAPPVALERLSRVLDVDGGLLYDEDSLPSEARIKRFFGAMCQKRKVGQRAEEAVNVQ